MLIKIIYVVMMNHALVSTLYEPELNVLWCYHPQNFRCVNIPLIINSNIVMLWQKKIITIP